jgi:phospholipase/lecithinase/hemolysin
MKKSCLFWMILLLGSVVFSTASAFNSLYVFGDGMCTTTNNAFPGKQYYGKRYTNGRVWVEFLAQRQGIGISNNWSSFGHDSGPMATDVNHFSAPTDAANDLFVVWAGDSDFVDFMYNNTLYPSLSLNAWNSAINSSLNSHYNIITNLYAKGARTMVLPNTVDITEIPAFNQMAVSTKNFVRGRVIYFNTNLLATINRAKTTCPGLTIYVPNVFSLLDNVITNAAYYGLTNVTLSGQPIDAYTYYTTNSIVYCTTNNGLGTNFIFWDSTDPTAQMHEVLADTVQQMISPVQVGGLTQINGSNRLDLVNVPVGLNGFLENCTNLAQASWSTVTNFNSTATAQSIFVVTPPLPANFGAGGSGGSGGSGGPPMPGSGSGTTTITDTNSYVNSAAQFYRLRFPYAWNWP